MQRYNRQLRYRAFGEGSQNTLSNTTILIFDAGALGNHVAELLARMGTHHLAIADMGIAELSNLHRQALYTKDDAHHMVPKVRAVKQKIGHINLNVNIQTYCQEVDSTTIEDILKAVNPDIVIDSMDHFKIHYLTNGACHKHHIPWVYGAAVGSKGTVYGIDFRGPCLKCLLKHIPTSAESYAINGVSSPVVTRVASYEVTEAIRHLSGHGFPHRLITLGAFHIDYKAPDIGILKDDEYDVCGKGHYELLETKQQRNIESLCGEAYLFRYQPAALDYTEHFPGDIMKSTSFAKLIKDGNYEITLFKSGRMNVYDAEDDNEVEQLYHQYLKSLK